jgi:hypothetical protein
MRSQQVRSRKETVLGLLEATVYYDEIYVGRGQRPGLNNC